MNSQKGHGSSSSDTSKLTAATAAASSSTSTSIIASFGAGAGNEIDANFERDMFNYLEASVQKEDETKEKFTTELIELLTNPSGIEKRFKEMEDEIEAIRADTQRIQEATKKHKETVAAENSRLKKRLSSLNEEYQKKKSIVLKLEEECVAHRDAWREEMAFPAFFEPLIEGLGIDFDTQLCAEGKPIHASGAEGTCNGWDCPKGPLNLENSFADLAVSSVEDKSASSVADQSSS